MTAHRAKHLYHLVGMPESNYLYVFTVAGLLGVTDETVCAIVNDGGLDSMFDIGRPLGPATANFVIPRRTILAVAAAIASPAAKLLIDVITASPDIVSQRDLFRLQAKINLHRLLSLGTCGRVAFADLARMLGTTTTELSKAARAEGLALDYPAPPAGGIPVLKTQLTALVSLEAAQLLVRTVDTPEASTIFDGLWGAAEARRSGTV